MVAERWWARFALPTLPLGLTAAPGPPRHGYARQDQPQQQNDGGDLQPDDAAQFPQNNLRTISPGVWQRVADRFNPVGCAAQGPFEQIGPIIEDGYNQYPRSNRRHDAIAVNLGVMLQTRIISRHLPILNPLERDAKTPRAPAGRPGG